MLSFTSKNTCLFLVYIKTSVGFDFKIQQNLCLNVTKQLICNFCRLKTELLKMNERSKNYLLIIVNYALTVKLIIFPFSLVSDASIRVVKYAKSMHLILIPITIIVTAFFVVKLSFTMSESFQHVAFIPSS